MNPDFPSRIALIAAVAANGVIGRDGGMPWHLPQDFRYFKAMTMGRRIIMGSRTWDSLPGLLPGREHVVISSRPLELPQDVRLAGSLEQALALPRAATPAPPSASSGSSTDDLVYVIGGAQVYAQALPYATDLYLTEIDADVEGDTRFPDWDRTTFEAVSRDVHSAPLARDGAPVRFAFAHYRRAGRNMPRAERSPPPAGPTYRRFAT